MDRESPEFRREYNRGIAYSACRSALWCAVAGEHGTIDPQAKERLLKAGYTTEELTKFFNADGPVSLQRAADIATALGLHFEVSLLDLDAGMKYTPAGRVSLGK